MAGRIPPQAMNERFFARLGLRGDEGKNLVPVDWLSEAITYLVTHPRHHGKTYHLASSQPVRVREIQRVVRDAIQEHSRRPLAKSASETELQGYEGLFHEYMSVYRSHWRDDPVFDISQSRAALAHLPCPPMDYPLLMRAARYPVERDFSLNTHERIELDLDMERHLERLFTTPHQQSSHSVAGDGDMVGLQITGCGGGQWHLLVRRGRLAGAGVGLPPGNAARFYLSASTFRSLVDGQRTVEDSINTGGVVVEGGPGGLDNLVDVLEQVVAT
jgi:hypothetical protein